MARIKQLTNNEERFCPIYSAKPENVKSGLPGAVCKGGEANYERAT